MIIDNLYALETAFSYYNAVTEVDILFFETMAVRDLRVYSEALDGNVFHYRDSNGLDDPNCGRKSRLQKKGWRIRSSNKLFETIEPAK